jgi:transporter family-2 protein
MLRLSRTSENLNSKDHKVNNKSTTWLFVVFAIAIASLNSLQARVNAELGFITGDGLLSAFLSITSGFVILLTVVAFSPKARKALGLVPVLLKTKKLAWWHLLGGASGAFYAVAQTTTGILLGVALFSVAIVSGQTLSSALADRYGIGPSGIHRLTPPRIIGTILVLVAVIVSVGGQINASFSVWVALVPFIAGFMFGLQLAVNGRVRQETSSVAASTFINFGVAAVLLFVLVAVKSIFIPLPSELPGELWLYTGGVLGSVFIAGSAFVVARIGVLVLGVSVVAGQLMGATVIDLIAPSPLHPLTVSTIAGVILAIVAVAISSISWKRRSESA